LHSTHAQLKQHRNNAMAAARRLRHWLLDLSLIVLSILAATPALAAIQIASARVWPAQDYTRVTIESQAPISSRLLSLKNPERLVLDLDNIEITPELERLAQKIGADDPYVKALRIGRFKPGIVRLVFDLKTEVKPQIFSLQPIAEYGHRLVLDIYPAHPVDPLLALLIDQSPPPPIEAATTAATPQPATEPAAPSVMMPPPPAAATTAPAETMAKPETIAGTHRLLIIAIDPGHGGEDPGAHGRYGTNEKTVTLAIARKLKTMVDADPSMRSMLTRDGDYFVPLGQRVEKARKVHADLFVSIHADAFARSTASGSSVFALSEHGATSSAARWLAKKENEADLIGGVNLDVPDPYLKMTLTDLSFTAQINDSLKLGKAVLSELGDINDLHHERVEQAGFAVLKAPDVPSILVETAFISNPEEEKKLKDDAYQKQIASAIFAGIKRYFAQNPPLARGPFAANP